MKLALVRQTYTPFGGAERFVERALDALRAQGTDVTIIARKWTGDATGILQVDPFYLGRTWRDVGFSFRVQQIIAESRFDIVQSHERIPGCHIYRAGDGVHATWLELRDKARGGLAWLLTNRSPWHSYVKEAEAAMFRHPNLRAVICNSHMVRDDIARRFSVAAEKLHVIYNGVDLDHFHPGLRDEHRVRVRTELGIPLDVPVVLFVGSGFERKGVHVLLRALAAMRRRDAHLVVVGKDRKQKAAEGIAQKLGLAGRIHFLGGLPDVRPYYGAADVFCLPTLYDPMPNAALEALACGLPVVTSTTCGAAELLGENASGFVCDPVDDKALASFLDRFEELDSQAARAVVSEFSLGAMASQLVALYTALGGGANSGRV